MLRTLTLLTLTAGVIASATVASAQVTAPVPHKRKVIREVQIIDPQPPLTVNRRSWLDPGPVVPVGTDNVYLTANTIFNRTPDQNFARSKFGNEALPAPLEVPGRPQPIVEFETPAYP